MSDLTAAAREIEARHGLASIDGGRHPGWGTANRIVPLGETHLELVAVVDESEAAQSPFGGWVGGMPPTLAQSLGWAVRTHQLDDVASSSNGGTGRRFQVAPRPGEIVLDANQL